VSSGPPSIEEAIAASSMLGSPFAPTREFIAPSDPDVRRGPASIVVKVVQNPGTSIFGDVAMEQVSCVGCTETIQAAGLVTETVPARFFASWMGAAPTMTDIVATKASFIVDTASYTDWVDQHLSLTSWQRSTAADVSIGRTSAQCYLLLLSRRGLLADEQFFALRRQLSSIFAAADESDDVTVSLTSLDGLIEFLARNQPDSHPSVSVGRDGRFAASWMHGPRAKVTLVFDRTGGEWAGVDLEARPPVRGKGSFVVNSLFGITQTFRNWIKA
jgi:hypothetical protein